MVALIGEALGVPVVRSRIATGTCRITKPQRAAPTMLSIVSPRYSTGYHCEKNSIIGLLQALKPEVVSVSLVPATRDSTTDSSFIAQERGPRTLYEPSPANRAPMTRSASSSLAIRVGT